MKNNKTALITGATSGIGKIIAGHLVKSGYTLIVLGRSNEKLNTLTEYLNTIAPSNQARTILCDLSSFSSVKIACDAVKASYSSIDLMILNAGLWNFEFIETEDNIEETLQVNLISPVLMFQELQDLIPKKKDSKIIFTSSGLHQGTIQFEDMEFRNNFSGFKSYRQSKLGLLLLTRWLDKQPQFSGISFYCVHPGMVNTQLGRSAGWLSRSIFKLFGKSKEKGAQTHIHLIDRSAQELKSGEYYANKKVTKTTSYSYQMEEAKKLWDVIHRYIKTS